MIRAGLAAWAAAAALAAAAAPAAGAEPFAVGERTYTFVDTSRSTNGDGRRPAARTRTLPTMVLYPAQGRPGGPTRPDALPVVRRRGGRFPLVVFSHGVTATGPTYRFALERLAREGYVVAAPTYPLTSGPGAPITDYVNQPADVRFVISRMLGLARRDSGLQRTIDTQRIAAAGHSLGAITTLGVAANSCCLDPRIDAAVAWSGTRLPFDDGRFFPKDTPPLLLIHGDADGTVPYAGSATAYRAAPAPKALVRLLGGPHSPFGPPHGDPLAEATLHFLDAYLGGDRRALQRLDDDARVPGAASLLRRLRPG